VWRTRSPFLVRHPWILDCPIPGTPSLDLRLVRVNQDP
jgi:hypothetical protein